MRSGSWSNVGQLLSAGKVNCPWIDLVLGRKRMDTGLIGDFNILVLSNWQAGGFDNKKYENMVFNKVSVVYQYQ